MEEFLKPIDRCISIPYYKDVRTNTDKGLYMYIQRKDKNLCEVMVNQKLVGYLLWYRESGNTEFLEQMKKIITIYDASGHDEFFKNTAELKKWGKDWGWMERYQIGADCPKINVGITYSHLYREIGHLVQEKGLGIGERSNYRMPAFRASYFSI